MPMERDRYPANWKQIAFAKKESVNWRCEVCGMQCRRPWEPFDTHKRTLTVAHLNHTPEDCRPENLMAMCAGFHLRYDARHHAETRRLRRETERECNTCRHYDPYEGYCRECDIYCRGTDGEDCEVWSLYRTRKQEEEK